MAIDVNVNISIACPDIRDAVKYIAETMTPRNTTQPECPPWTVTSTVGAQTIKPGCVADLAPSATASIDTTKTARRKYKKAEPIAENLAPATESVTPIAESPAPVTPEPVAPPVETAIPTTPVQPAEVAPGPIPTANTHYTKSDLITGIQELVDKDTSNQSKVLDLLSGFGAKKLSDLSEDYYDMFAYKLRQMGAQI